MDEVQTYGNHIGRTEKGCYDVYELYDFYVIVNDETGGVRVVKNQPDLR